MARGRPPLVSANAGIHDWPLLKDGLFTLETVQDLTSAIQELIKLPAEEWKQRAKACRSAAEQLNRGDDLPMVGLLAKHAAQKRSQAVKALISIGHARDD